MERMELWRVSSQEQMLSMPSVWYLYCIQFFDINDLNLKLNNDSCSESEVKEDDDVESARNASPSLQIEKKKKKRKKKTGKKLAARSSEDNLDPTDEVEASVRWVEENVGQPVMLRKDQKEEKVNPLKKVLSIENKHLNPENEMKRIFGSRVVASESSRHK